jgi:hypothetical protein
MFAFVDGLSNSYQSTTIRSHVMTNAYQAKKRLRGCLEDKPAKPITWTLELVSSPGTPTAHSPPDVVPHSQEIDLDLANYWVSNHPSMQPRTILGAGRIDHFSTLPIPRTELIDEFVAACALVYPPLQAQLIMSCRSGTRGRLWTRKTERYSLQLPISPFQSCS